MARIQILQLPPYGRDGEQPFALIVDQCETPPQRIILEAPVAEPEHIRSFGSADLAQVARPVEFTDPWREFAKDIGAAGVIVTQDRVDIVNDTDDDRLLVEFDNAALSESVVAALRAHLESPEASEAFQAYVQRQMSRRDG